MIRASAVSAPTRVTSSTSGASRLRLPADSSRPGSACQGSGSPVRLEASTAEYPSTTTPSTGTRSPASSCSRSPGRKAPTRTSRMAPSGSTRRAVSGCSWAQLMQRLTGAEAGPFLQEAPQQHETQQHHRLVEKNRASPPGARSVPQDWPDRRCRPPDPPGCPCLAQPPGQPRIHPAESADRGPSKATVASAAWNGRLPIRGNDRWPASLR